MEVSQPNLVYYSHIATEHLRLQGEEETRTDKNQHRIYSTGEEKESREKDL